MILTEAEASGKRCPIFFAARCMAEAVGYSDVSTNCKGSSCMAWRWLDEEYDVDDTWRGYCGLAGMPTCCIAKTMNGGSMLC